MAQHGGKFPIAPVQPEHFTASIKSGRPGTLQFTQTPDRLKTFPFSHMILGHISIIFALCSSHISVGSSFLPRHSQTTGTCSIGPADTWGASGTLDTPRVCHACQGSMAAIRATLRCRVSTLPEHEQADSPPNSVQTRTFPLPLAGRRLALKPHVIANPPCLRHMHSPPRHMP
jgi:hypothetical protein